MKVLTNWILLVLLLCTQAELHVATAANEATSQHRWVDAVPKERAPPRYPLRASSKTIEGWVVVSFIVDVDGITKDITITDTSIADTFEIFAIRAVEKWTYEPATLDGVPVQRAKTSVRIVWALEGLNGAVTGKFLRIYKKADKAIRAGKLENAKTIIDRMDQRKKKRLSESGYLDFLKAMYWQKMGDGKQARQHFQRVRIVEDFIDSEVHFASLRQLFVLSANVNHLGNSIWYYNRLVELDKDLSPDDPIHDIASRVRDVLESDTPFAIQGKVEEPCEYCKEIRPFWDHHSLSRERFTLDQIEGKVDEFKLLCGFQYATVPWSADLIWTVKNEWGQCGIHVFGELGTTFRLVQY